MAQFWKVKRHLNKVAGVYQITVMVDGREHFYVGQSVNVPERWVSHIVDLVSNSHHCHALQAAYDVAGLNRLTFKILEWVPDGKGNTGAMLRTLERKWINRVPKAYLLNS